MSIFRKKDVGLSQTEMKRHLTLRDVVLVVFMVISMLLGVSTLLGWADGLQ